MMMISTTTTATTTTGAAIVAVGITHGYRILWADKLKIPPIHPRMIVDKAEIFELPRKRILPFSPFPTTNACTK